MADTERVLETLERELAFVGERRPDPGVEDLACHRADEVLHELWRRGELAGATPEEAYRVRCDGRTGTAADRAAGRVVLKVGLGTGRVGGGLEEHTLVLPTLLSRPPEIVERHHAVAAAARLARERLGFVRRVTLAPAATARVEETEAQLERLFDSAATANAVLLLEDADALFVGPTQQRLRMERLLERLSADTGVRYVLTR